MKACALAHDWLLWIAHALANDWLMNSLWKLVRLYMMSTSNVTWMQYMTYCLSLQLASTDELRLLVCVLLCLFLSWWATSKVVRCWTKRLTYCCVKHIQVNGASTTSTPWIHALTLLWRLGSTLWCDVIAAQRNCLCNWFLVVCLPAGPVAYAWFARWVYCLISLMMVASWMKEQCFAGIRSCICSPNGWFCFFQESDTWLQSVMPLAMVNFHFVLGKYRINCRGRHVFSVRSCTWAWWAMDYKRGEHAIFPRLELVHMCWLGWRLVPSSPSSLGCCHDQLCWNLMSIMALWVSACKTKVPYTR